MCIQAIDVKFSQDLTQQKSLKSHENFSQVNYRYVRPVGLGLGYCVSFCTYNTIQYNTNHNL